MSQQGLAENPYAPPDAGAPPLEEAPPLDGEAARRDGVRALLALPAFLGLVAAGGLAASFAWLPGVVVCAAAAAVAIGGTVLGVRSLSRRVLASAPGLGVAVVLAVLANGAMSVFGLLLTLFATVGFRRGRQLRSFGRVLLPRVQASNDWAHLDLPAAVDEDVSAAVAAQWRENGRTEHASVAAFARLTLDLMALGAPPALVAAANRDALDEIRHTELCFSLARALDGKGESPGAFPEASRARTLPASRTLALAALAVDSLVDGALHEGVSARVIGRLVRRCEQPQIRAVLKEIAADEGRHAAHGWDVVAWCLTEGGSAVADALRGALAALPREARSPLPEGAWDGGWERLGIHGHALEAEELAAARAALVRRVERMLGEAQPAAA
jgi:hypothetical protein